MAVSEGLKTFAAGSDLPISVSSCAPPLSPQSRAESWGADAWATVVAGPQVTGTLGPTFRGSGVVLTPELTGRTVGMCEGHVHAMSNCTDRAAVGGIGHQVVVDDLLELDERTVTLRSR